MVSAGSGTGCALAQNNLGVCYENGIGVAEDKRKAFSGTARLQNRDTLTPSII